MAAVFRHYSTGDNYRSLKILFKISSKTIQKIIIEVSDAIFDISGPINMLPTKNKEWMRIAEKFKKIKDFPQILGAIDGKHVS